MRSLTSPRAKRISGPKNFRSSGEKDFFNTICHKRSFNDGVSAQPKRFRNVQPDGLGSSEIHNEFKFVKQIAGLVLLKARQHHRHPE
jgi:hypothetical protein